MRITLAGISANVAETTPELWLPPAVPSALQVLPVTVPFTLMPKLDK